MEVVSKKNGYGHLISMLIKTGDVLVVNLFFVLIYHLFKYSFWANGEVGSHEIGEIILLINLSYFITSSIIKVDISSNIIFFDKIVQRSVSFITLYCFILTVGLSLLNVMNYSLLLWIATYILLCLIYTLWHVLFRIALKWYRKKGYNYKRMVIVGGGLNGINVYRDVVSSVYGYRFLGFFDDNQQVETTIPNYLGNISDVEQFCLENKVDEIYCTLPNSQEAKIIRLMNFAEKNTIRFFLVPEFYKYIKRRVALTFLQSTPVIAIREEPLQLMFNRAIKRTFDICFSSIVLVTVFPVIYIVFGSIIKLTSRGPVFFKQRRTGLQGKEFNCYKFRSMRLNKESDRKTTSKLDPRVTCVGRFMRKTSIDELPQFINVFKGNMSVVGPRPHMIRETQLYTKLIDRFMIRHLIKPGITGWAQISGYRGETKTIEQMEKRFKCDIWYLENWSFFLDIKIVFVTILNVFRGEDNAY